MNTAQAETCEKIAEARILDTADTSWSAVAKHKLAELGDEAHRSAQRMQVATTEAIRREPAWALVVAAALGGALGILVKRRFD